VIILDTNVVSAVMANDTRIDPWLSRARATEMFTTVMTRAEIRFGLARLPTGTRRDDLQQRADRFFAEVSERLLVFDAAAADRYGELVARRMAAGQPISVPDGIIVSIARSRRASLATRNVRDFVDCGVQVVNPFEE